MSTINQGDIFNFDFGPQHDSRMEGPHPALVVQTDLLNRIAGYELVVIVPLSTKGRNSPSHVALSPSNENGLSELSFAKCEQIYTVPKSGLLQKRGALSQSDLYKVKEALKLVLSI